MNQEKLLKLQSGVRIGGKGNTQEKKEGCSQNGNNR